MGRPLTSLTVRVGGAGGIVTALHGREAWALDKLVLAGARGVTPIDTPAPRWSHYVFLLRQRGVSIATIHEAHGGPFPGHHARYVLRADVEILEREDAAHGRAHV